MPEGFRYQTGWISEAEEASLVASLAALKLEPFEFHGHLGNRRVASFGLRYDYTRRAVEAAAEYPSFLDNFRIKCCPVRRPPGRRVPASWSKRVQTGRWNWVASG
jgi:hypothetical protein